MKLSNKILIGFFGFLFLYLTAVFAEIRLSGTPYIVDDSNSVGETVETGTVNFVVLRNLDESINIVTSDKPQLEVRSLSGDALEAVKYKISGDTLTLYDLQSDDIKPVRITVFVRPGGFARNARRQRGGDSQRSHAGASTHHTGKWRAHRNLR